jgi:FlaA1/EpsC-like NDP-sugar epimerase
MPPSSLVPIVAISFGCGLFVATHLLRLRDRERLRNGACTHVFQLYPASVVMPCPACECVNVCSLTSRVVFILVAALRYTGTACSRTRKHLAKKSQRSTFGIDLARYIPLVRDSKYRQKVVVLGAGSFGTAMAYAAAQVSRTSPAGSLCSLSTRNVYFHRNYYIYIRAGTTP